MRRLTSRWYWRYRLELVMGRFGWVPLTEYRKLQASYMKVCAENWKMGQVQGCELPWDDTIALQRIYNAWHARRLDALSRTLHPPIIITTDYRRGTPCS